MNFSERLNELMFDKKIVIKTFASVLNVSESAVREWKNNIKEITLINIIKVADYFNCSIDYLVGRDECGDLEAVYKTAPPFFEALSRTMTKYNTNPFNLSTRTGISRNLIKGYMRGTRKPAINNVIKIAAALDCRVDELVGRE